MSRKIFISDAMCLDEALIGIAAEPGGATATMLWPWVLMSLDDWGRGSANPAIIKAKVAPAFDSITREMFADAVDLYVRAGILRRYEANGSTIIAAIEASWWRYQTHVAREKRQGDGSRFAPPPPRQDTFLSGSGISRDLAESRAIPRDSRENCSSPSLSPSPSPSPSESLAGPTRARAKRRLPAGEAPDGQAVRQHPNAPIMAIFDAEFGQARTPAEIKRRALAANELRAGNATEAEVQRAIRQWPKIYPGATCTPHAIAGNFATLLGPVRSKTQGTVDATMEWLAGGFGSGSDEGGIRGGDEPFVGGVSARTDDVARGQAGGPANVLGGDRAIVVVDRRSFG